MVYRLWDEDVLREKADFSLLQNIKNVYDEPNPDGTDPVVTIKAEGTTISFAVAMLHKLAENDGESIIEATWVASADALGVDPYDATSEEAILGEMSRVSIPFLEFTLNGQGTSSHDDDGSVEFTITAPSYMIAIQGFLAATSKDNLRAFVTGLMPAADDEDDF